MTCRATSTVIPLPFKWIITVELELCWTSHQNMIVPCAPFDGEDAPRKLDIHFASASSRFERRTRLPHKQPFRKRALCPFRVPIPAA